jgi:predicted RNase H-like HicB family nuclease
MKITPVLQDLAQGCIGVVEELPGANTQGKTLDEARENLTQAIEWVLEADRTLADESLDCKDVIRESLTLA